MKKAPVIRVMTDEEILARTRIAGSFFDVLADDYVWDYCCLVEYPCEVHAGIIDG